MVLNVCEELEKIIMANLSLLDVEDSITRLRVAKVDEGGVDCILISPDDPLGYLGFEYNSSAAPLIKYCSTDRPGVTFFDMSDTYVGLHSSRDTWPEGLEYHTVDFGDYNFAVGQFKELESQS